MAHDFYHWNNTVRTGNTKVVVFWEAKCSDGDNAGWIEDVTAFGVFR